MSLHRDRLPLSGTSTKPCAPSGYLQATRRLPWVSEANGSFPIPSGCSAAIFDIGVL